MTSLRFTLLAAACAVALSACSSKGPNRYPEPATTPKVTEAQKAAEQKLAEKEKEIAALKTKQAELSQALTDAKNQRDALSQKESLLDQKIAELTTQNTALAGNNSQLISENGTLKTQNNTLAQEKSSLEQQKQSLANEKKALDDKISALETEKATLITELEIARPIVAQVEKEKADELRVAKNRTEVKKGFVDNGVDDANVSYVSGALLAIDGNTLSYRSVAEKSQQLNTLMVDGKALELFTHAQIVARQETYEHDTHNLDDINADGFTGKVGSLPKKKIGDDFAQMRFGYVTNANGSTTLFVQGHQTPTNEVIESPFDYFRAGAAGEKAVLRVLPTTGRFEYEGHAFYGKDNQYQPFAVKALADLDNKKVKVNLQEDDNPRLTFGGVIEGNRIAGHYNGIEMNGAFYGTKGKDIGGLFYQTQGAEKDFTGVFGATQKDCGWVDCPTPAEDLKAFAVESQ